MGRGKRRQSKQAPTTIVAQAGTHSLEVSETEAEGVVRWRNSSGQLHREDGPALEWPNGRREWWLNGQRHRKDGPALEGADGRHEWWLNGQRHREDGPACETAFNWRAWYR